jgi:hypothetical protein
MEFKEPNADINLMFLVDTDTYSLGFFDIHIHHGWPTQKKLRGRYH